MPEVVVLGTHGGRQFKAVFEEAQKELRDKFGMEMTELPVKEKVTISQRRGMATFFGSFQHIGSGYSVSTGAQAHSPCTPSRPTHRKTSHHYENLDPDHNSPSEVS